MYLGLRQPFCSVAFLANEHFAPKHRMEKHFPNSSAMEEHYIHRRLYNGFALHSCRADSAAAKPHARSAATTCGHACTASGKHGFNNAWLFQRLHVSQCTLRAQPDRNSDAWYKVQREGPPFGDLVLSLMEEACDQKGEPCKLTWQTQHEVVLRHEDCV